MSPEEVKAAEKELRVTLVLTIQILMILTQTQTNYQPKLRHFRTLSQTLAVSCRLNGALMLQKAGPGPGRDEEVIRLCWEALEISSASCLSLEDPRGTQGKAWTRGGESSSMCKAFYR